MTMKKTAKKNHDELMDFLIQTANDYGYFPCMIKATLGQVLQNILFALKLEVEKNNGSNISKNQIINIQITALKDCIMELKECLQTEGFTEQ